MLRIGLVTGEYPPHQGGVGDFSRELALAFAQLGHTVHVITHTAGQAAESLQVHPTVQTWSIAALYQIRNLARSLPLDIVNIQYQTSAYGMTAPIHFLPKILARPSVITFHDLLHPYLFPKAGPLRGWLFNYFARSASGVILTNPLDYATLKATGQIRGLTEIPIGSNVNPFATYAGRRNRDYGARWGLQDSDVVIGYFGFLNRSKGGSTLYAALAELPDCKLLHIGGHVGTADQANALYAQELDVLAKQLGIADRIIRTGFLPPTETTQAFLSCDLMAMPYRDGVSFRRGTFMACLAHGMPTITTQPNVELPDLQDRINVRLVLSEDPAALAAAIREVAGADTLRQQLSTGALQLADQFTWDKIARRTAAFFEQVLSAPPVDKQ